MMRRGPCRPARSRARSCTRKGSGERRSRRSARSPRAGFGLDGPRGTQVLEPHVPGADGDRVGVHLVEEPAVDVDLLLLAREAPAAAEEVLGAEEADALRAVELRGRRLLGELHVGLEAHGDAVEGARGEGARPLQALLLAPVASWAARKPSRAAPDGSTTTSPRVPSTTTRLPGGICRVASSRPATAGMPRERAMMAVW